MSLVYQNDFSEDSGNCVPACIATAFGMKLEDVPHFLKANNANWVEPFEVWLQSLTGFMPFFTPVKRALQIVLAMKNMPYFVIGEVGKSEYHMCLAQNGNLIHDPNPAGSGIRKVKDYVFLLQVDSVPMMPDFTFEQGRYLEEGRMGICIQQDCKCVTTSRVYEHTLTMQRRHFLCHACLEKLGFKNGEVLTRSWQG